MMEDKNGVQYNVPPNEDVLLRKTLWPELNKLYGHGFEI
jgi:elongator complex protein 2